MTKLSSEFTVRSSEVRSSLRNSSLVILHSAFAPLLQGRGACLAGRQGRRSGWFLFFLALAALSNAYGQDTAYARHIIRTLTSSDMHGRGYVNDGDAKAAIFIANEFGKLKLNTFNSGFTQRFSVSVNSLPGVLALDIEGITLTPGEDYLVDACSPDLQGQFPLIYMKPKTVLNQNKLSKFLNSKKVKDKVVVIDKTKLDLATPENKERYALLRATFESADGMTTKALIELTNDKLTWGGAQSQCVNPIFTVKKEAWYSTASVVQIAVDAEFHLSYPTQNVIGWIEGSTYPDSFILFSAHYDHLGRMGAGTYFPGANDNASGIAMLLDLARHFSQPGNRPECSIAFIAFGGEEIGLLGSKHYTDNPLFDLGKIKLLVNMDIVGTGDEGITVVNGSVFKSDYDKLVALNDSLKLLPEIKPRGKAQNSDHYWFSEKGVKAFFIYTRGGIKAYHDIYDRPETLPLTEYEDLWRVLVAWVEAW